MVDRNNDGLDEDICDIMSEACHHTINATDDYFDEREPLNMCTSEPNTTLFTGEELQVNDHPDDRPRVSAEQRQNGKLPKNSEVIGTSKGDDPSEEDRLPSKSNRIGFIKAVCFFILPIGVIFGITVIVIKLYLPETIVTSTYSGVVTMHSPKYFVTRHDIYGYANVTYRYEKITVIVSTSGFYRFECNKDNYPHFVYFGTIELYTKSFNTANLSMNRLKYKDGDEGIHRNSFGVQLQSINYILVVSITDIREKSFYILITGPASVAFS